jgi:hypothetical protein
MIFLFILTPGASLVDRLSVYLQPVTGILQTLDRGWMEEPLLIRSQADHEVSTLGHDVDQVGNDPFTGLVFGAVPLVGELIGQRVV